MAQFKEKRDAASQAALMLQHWKQDTAHRMAEEAMSRAHTHLEKNYWLRVARIIRHVPVSAKVVVPPMTLDQIQKMSQAVQDAGFTCTVEQSGQTAVLKVQNLPQAENR